MGLKRFLWRLSPTGNMISMIKNIVEEKSILKGTIRLEEERRKDIQEIRQSTPLYKMGLYDGKMEGFNDASKQYEQKLLQQGDAFLKQAKLYKDQINDYESLLNDYEKEIEALKSKLDRTESEEAYLRELLLKEKALRKLQQ